MYHYIQHISVENAPEIQYTLQSSSCVSNHSTQKPEMTATNKMKSFLNS